MKLGTFMSCSCNDFTQFLFCQSKPIAFLPLSFLFLKHPTVAFGKLSLQYVARKMILGIVTLKNKSKRKQVGQMFLDGVSEIRINCLFSAPFPLYMMGNIGRIQY